MPVDYKSIAVELAATVDHIMTELANEQDVTYEQEGIVVAAGIHQFTFKTDAYPKRIYLTVESGDVQVCGAATDLVGATINSDGFTIYANIVSNTAIIKWIMLV